MLFSKISIIGTVLLLLCCNSPIAFADKIELKSLPDSEKQYSEDQINDFFDVPDWYPQSHPEMPEVVKHGAKPDVFACASCHLTSGSGHPESASLAGLPADYIYRQLKAYQQFQRPSLIGTMISIARGMTDEQMIQAANYFAALPPRKVQEVIEVNEVPKTYVNDRFMRLELNGTLAGKEPIGERVITVPRDEYRVKARDPFEIFITYVPAGYMELGKKLVSQGGNGATPCTSCHGVDLKGTPVAPPIAGQHASYLVSQLRAYKEGIRRGEADPGGIMANNLKYFKDREILAAAAYIASLDRN